MHDPRFVTVSDETSDPVLFTGILLGEPCPKPDVGDSASILVGVTGPSGFGWDVGPQVATLKYLGDGRYGA